MNIIVSLYKSNYRSHFGPSFAQFISAQILLLSHIKIQVTEGWNFRRLRSTPTCHQDQLRSFQAPSVCPEQVRPLATGEGGGGRPRALDGGGRVHIPAGCQLPLDHQGWSLIPLSEIPWENSRPRWGRLKSGNQTARVCDFLPGTVGSGRLWQVGDAPEEEDQRGAWFWIWWRSILSNQSPWNEVGSSFLQPFPRTICCEIQSPRQKL